MNRFEWSDAGTVEQALAQLGPTSVIKAGGVDVMDLLKEDLIAPSRLVNIRTVRGLDRIAEAPSAGLRIGPLVTLSRLAAEPVIVSRYRALAEAAGRAATPQIRAMATVGGNLLQRPRCWYFRSHSYHCLKKGGPKCFAREGENAYHAIFGNGKCAIVHPSAAATALVALSAKLELTSAKGKREAPLEGFFVAPEVNVLRENALGEDELITEIRVPAQSAGSSSAYIKQGEKESFDWPVAEAAVVLEQSGGRVTRAKVVLGAAAPVPYRARAAEAELLGKAIDEDRARAAAKAALSGASPLAQNAYKLPIFEAIVRRAILAAAGGGSR
ncbi:MAG: FAD binding domain-containing protein [Polyangiaceae bacterium]|nr:FAD binding domain-containing protein [Polyangiaceae bacterium]